jgi:hypothetical protein
LPLFRRRAAAPMRHACGMIRSFREGGFGRFLELAHGERWSCGRAELAAFLAADPEGCLVFEQQARAVGFVMAYPHERSA